jgi:hypothetical protein
MVSLRKTAAEKEDLPCKPTTEARSAKLHLPLAAWCHARSTRDRHWQHETIWDIDEHYNCICPIRRRTRWGVSPQSQFSKFDAAGCDLMRS